MIVEILVPTSCTSYILSKLLSLLQFVALNNSFDFLFADATIFISVYY